MKDGGKGSLLVLSGPSGVGKSTVIGKLLDRWPDTRFSVSFTTRRPRENEVDGVNYHYVSIEEFERMIREGELLEFTQYVGNYYGTSRKVIEDWLAAGLNVLLDIEVEGAANVKRQFPGAALVFIVPPSMEELAARLRSRGTDDEQTIAKRLRRAVEECREIGQYEFLVVNGAVDQAAEELSAILLAERCRLEHRMDIAYAVSGYTERKD